MGEKGLELHSFRLSDIFVHLKSRGSHQRVEWTFSCMRGRQRAAALSLLTEIEPF